MESEWSPASVVVMTLDGDDVVESGICICMELSKFIVHHFFYVQSRIKCHIKI